MVANAFRAKDAKAVSAFSFAPWLRESDPERETSFEKSYKGRIEAMKAKLRAKNAARGGG